MKKIAIIGASYLQLPLITKAKSFGYETHVFAWKVNDCGESAADYFYPISIVEKEKILNECKKIEIDAICSIASDLATITVNYIAEIMGLNGNSLTSTLCCTNKWVMREKFSKRNDPSPKSIMITDFNQIDKRKLTYPIIVKPSDRSGSRGITKLNSSVGLKNAVALAMKESFSNEVLIEEYINGQEYSVECISFKSQHYYLATTLKHTTGAPNFIETGHEEPAGLSNEIVRKIKSIIFHALDTLKISNGASHSEIKIDENSEIKIIEIGARMGGDCIGSHLVEYSTGYDYLKMVLDIALNKKPNFNKAMKTSPVEVKYIFNQKDIDDLLVLEKHYPHSILYKTEINMELLGKITDSSNRLGCYIHQIGMYHE